MEEILQEETEENGEKEEVRLIWDEITGSVCNPSRPEKEEHEWRIRRSG